MKGMGLRKLKTGAVESVDPHLLGRVIGSKGVNLADLKEKTDTRIIVADNARVWIDGDVVGIISARAELGAMMKKAKVSEYGGDV
jgi:exosome complex RNA-binding protein Rrp4